MYNVRVCTGLELQAAGDIHLGGGSQQPSPHACQSIWVGAGSMNSSGMWTLVTLRGRYLRLARSLGGSGARLRGPERGAGARCPPSSAPPPAAPGPGVSAPN